MPKWVNIKILQWIATNNCILKTGEDAAGISRTRATEFYDKLYENLGLPEPSKALKNPALSHFVALIKEEFVDSKVRSLGRKLRQYGYFTLDPITGKRHWDEIERNKLKCKDFNGVLQQVRDAFPNSFRDHSIPASPRGKMMTSTVQDSEEIEMPEDHFGTLIASLVQLLKNEQSRRNLPKYMKLMAETLHEHWNSDVSAITELFETTAATFEAEQRGRVEERRANLENQMRQLQAELETLDRTGSAPAGQRNRPEDDSEDESIAVVTGHGRSARSRAKRCRREETDCVL